MKKKYETAHAKELHPLKLLASKNTNIQEVKTIRDSEQIIKNLFYVMLINL